MICLRYGISYDAFRAMNTQILPDCSNLWVGYSYCVYNVTAPPKSAAIRADCVAAVDAFLIQHAAAPSRTLRT